MKKYLTVALAAGALAPFCFADGDNVDTIVPVQDVVRFRMHADGTFYRADGNPGPRVSSTFYDSTGGLYYTTTATPRWHGGDICSFAPENPGVTDTLINVVEVPIGVPANTTGSTGRAIFRFWNVDPTLCNDTNGVFESQIGAFQLNIGDPGLTTTTNGTIFIFEVPIDDVFPDTGGLVFPTDTFGVSYEYRNTDGTPHSVPWTFAFAANYVNTADPADPANCVDPENQPLVGSSIVQASPLAALYLRDADSSGGLTNTCPSGTPNEFRLSGRPVLEWSSPTSI